ncbi:S8/S53 family peptidase [Streptosporangium lutulentum]
MTQGHAVHLAGILAQQAPNADLIVRQALTDFEVDSWTLATKMVEFRNEVDILVTALGGTTWDNQPPMVLRRAEARLGCVHVSSAGNWGNVDDPLRFPSPTRRSAIFPGALADVIAVGALDESGERTPYSQSGPWVTAMAPGRHGSLFLERAGLVGRDAKGVFFSTGVVELFGGFARWDGTSAAAAYFAGVVAAEAQNRETSVEEAVHRLLDGPATSRIRPFDPERDKY